MRAAPWRAAIEPAPRSRAIRARNVDCV
ncbi:hypothetical protein CBM2634_A230116 [Cupriavidus taiwanensis]|uniref:Uncharacterized protein n=1 Tax=Cupriavidus taiwanensis TaxID=164546 RepID=A0A375J319_9BURK|nr:hypothetical protein CBM2634_A230116 [Cupriavidus taiwanensis]